MKDRENQPGGRYEERHGHIPEGVHKGVSF